MASDPNIGFIHAPGLIGGFQMKPSSLFEFRSVTLDPSPNGGVMHPRVSLLEKLLDLAIGKRVSEVPADGTENDFGSKVALLKDRTFGHNRGMVDRAKRFLQHIPFVTCRPSTSYD